MTDAGFSVSLLPYLDSTRATTYLKFSLSTREPSLLEKITTPFLVIDDSDPLARLMEAQFLTDAGNVLRKVFALVQKDRYRLAEDELWPVANQDVENAWQHAFSFFNGEGDRRQLTTLSGQITEGGKLIPLAPLFFCKARQVFFGPPCPRCGAALHQCTDDDLLSARGLQPYSRSLKRYLFCPSCDARGPADFYIYELDNHDPPGLKDRWTLIKEFGLLLKSSALAGEFPCRTCDRSGECFGLDMAAPSRIVPFAFYPFYMLMFEAMSLQAVDFLALLSGATSEEVEAGLKSRGEFGRLNCLTIFRDAGLLETRFFYEHQEKFFLEVLYLKLSFLGEVVRVFSTAKVFEHPDIRLSLHHIWVKVADQSNLLPSFWNFRAEPVNISGPMKESAAVAGSPSNSALYFNGLVWFYTLLVNKRQGISEVSRLLKELLAGDAPIHGPSSGTPFENRNSPTFAPVNLFWDVHHHYVPESWYRLWEKSLTLGWSLLVAGIRGDPQWSQEEFSRQFAELRDEVKVALFDQTSDRYQEPYSQLVRQLPDDATIHDVLVKLIAKWRAATEEAESGVRPETRMEEKKDEMTQTIIVSMEDLKKESTTLLAKAEQMMEETAIVSAGEGEMVPETVIISANEIGKQAELGVESKESGLQGAQKEKPEKHGEDEFLAETVILTIEKKKAK
ncbi:MAG TPA: hypothetical protein VKF36_11225 [Syntrophorhabdales bacterium]|nr:hypothetical protein [Syntrophorhabdales bacterium]